MTCTAETPEARLETRAAGTSVFSMDWLTQPMDPDGALAFIAEEIVAY